MNVYVCISYTNYAKIYPFIYLDLHKQTQRKKGNIIYVERKHSSLYMQRVKIVIFFTWKNCTKPTENTEEFVLANKLFPSCVSTQ